MLTLSRVKAVTALLKSQSFSSRHLQWRKEGGEGQGKGKGGGWSVRGDKRKEVGRMERKAI